MKARASHPAAPPECEGAFYAELGLPVVWELARRIEEVWGDSKVSLGGRRVGEELVRGRRAARACLPGRTIAAWWRTIDNLASSESTS